MATSRERVQNGAAVGAGFKPALSPNSAHPLTDGEHEAKRSTIIDEPKAAPPREARILRCGPIGCSVVLAAVVVVGIALYVLIALILTADEPPEPLREQGGSGIDWVEFNSNLLFGSVYFDR